MLGGLLIAYGFIKGDPDSSLRDFSLISISIFALVGYMMTVFFGVDIYYDYRIMLMEKSIAGFYKYLFFIIILSAISVGAFSWCVFKLNEGSPAIPG